MDDVQDALDQRRSFQEQQQSGLGATDTPKILGLSKWGSPLSVYQSKVDPPTPDESSLPAWLGLKLQSTVGELYTAATGQRLRAANGHYRHKTHPWLVCHLDFRGLHRPNLLVEAKTRAYMKGWGADGTGEIPDDVWAQVQHEMMVTGATETHVAVLFGHHTFRVYQIFRHDAFIAGLMDKLDDFWHNHVLARVPPLPSAHPMDAQILADKYPENDPFYRAATPTQMELVREYRAALTREAEAKQQVELLKNRLKDVIGDHLGLEGPFGTITWKKTKDSTRVGWEQVASLYRKALDGVMLDSLVRSQIEMAESLYTTVTPGVRRFTTEFAEEA